jgi:hypothetical protein
LLPAAVAVLAAAQVVAVALVDLLQGPLSFQKDV